VTGLGEAARNVLGARNAGSRLALSAQGPEGRKNKPGSRWASSRSLTELACSVDPGGGRTCRFHGGDGRLHTDELARATVTPYNSSAGCACSCRSVQRFQHIHSANSDGSRAANEWENFVSACPVRRSASVTVTASNWNQTWTVAKDNYLWLQDVGTVTCVFTTCASTNDIASFSVAVTSQTTAGDGLINYMAEAYGP
jgi:hypothetical protein